MRDELLGVAQILDVHGGRHQSEMTNLNYAFGRSDRYFDSVFHGDGPEGVSEEDIHHLDCVNLVDDFGSSRVVDDEGGLDELCKAGDP